MFFETKRLIVRELTLADITSFDEMQSNKSVMKYIIGRPKTMEENINELEKILYSYKKNSSDFLVMAVVKKDSNEFIGTCAIVKDDNGEHEIGYRFIEKYWGNGYGKEISGGLVKFAFESLCLNEVVAYVNKFNYSSVKILDGSELNFIRAYEESETGDLIRYYKLLKSEYNAYCI